MRHPARRKAFGVVLCSGLAACLAPTTAADEDATPLIERLGTVMHKPIDEMSGIVKSRTYPDVYWVQNDSGDEARIFAIDGGGQVIIPDWLRSRYRGESADPDKELWPGLPVLQASNIDWEDLALAEGHLYIGDIGNNGNARRDLGIYVLNEPNPRATDRSRILRFLPVRYPEQKEFPGRLWHYDSEALFTSEGKLYVITRHRPPGKIGQFEPGAKLYRLDTRNTDRENVLSLVDAHDEIVAASAADISPDGRLLAVLSYNALWVFEKPEHGDRWFQGHTRNLELSLPHTKQAEAICWENDDTLRLTNEQREIFRVALSSLQALR